MASLKRARGPTETVCIHEDEAMAYQDHSEEDTEEAMDESRGPLEESGCTHSEESEEEIEQSVAEDIERFEQSFKDINQRYRLINRIGEGTFSTVYKAEDLHYHHYDNSWDIEAKENAHSKQIQQHRPHKPRYVAIKKIYVTSSPNRILNELSLLHDLRSSPSVCPLITAFRHTDQVIAVLPYFQHRDFREYFRTFTVQEMRHYFFSLFTALKFVHKARIIHRDIKPTNFLYSPEHARG
ncbi:Cell division control protein 7, partial [Elasticomyces elasticus]